MVDQSARKKMAEAIRSYLDERIAAFEFDETLEEIRTTTDDITVQKLVVWLRCFYDDYKDHKIVATKEQWNLLHRILLLLETDGEPKLTFKQIREHRWSVRQLIAVCALIAFAFGAIRLGWGEYYVILSIPFGILSVLLHLWNLRAPLQQRSMESALVPFSSVSELMAARRKVSVFAKKRYPSHLESRKFTHPIVDILTCLLAIALCLAFPPVVLLFQALPDTNTTMKVIVH